MFASKKLVTAAALALAGMMAAPAASARPVADIYSQCGLGAMIFQETHWAAITSNIIWDLGTTAVSSDVSSADSCKGKTAKTAAYIFHSYAQLEQDLAQGQGQHLTALMSSTGCSASAQAQITTGLRGALAAQASSAAYSTATRLDQSKALFEALAVETQAASCSI
jgi:hypothetical protein